jgi:hypothetical protein
VQRWVHDHRWDLGLAVWAAAWFAVAAFVFVQVRAIGELSDSLVVAAQALHGTADGLGQIESTVEALPFVGQVGGIDRIQRSLRQAGNEARASARDARSSVQTLAWLLAVITGLVPTLPLLALRLAFHGRLPAT